MTTDHGSLRKSDFPLGRGNPDAIDADAANGAKVSRPRSESSRESSVEADQADRNSIQESDTSTSSLESIGDRLRRLEGAISALVELRSREQHGPGRKDFEFSNDSPRQTEDKSEAESNPCESAASVSRPVPMPIAISEQTAIAPAPVPVRVATLIDAPLATALPAPAVSPLSNIVSAALPALLSIRGGSSPFYHPWLPIEAYRELKAIWRMYFDRRYRLSRTAWLVPVGALAFMLSSLFFLDKILLFFAVPLIGPLLMLLTNLVLAYFSYKVLLREAVSYLESTGQTPTSKR